MSIWKGEGEREGVGVREGGGGLGSLPKGEQEYTYLAYAQLMLLETHLHLLAGSYIFSPCVEGSKQEKKPVREYDWLGTPTVCRPHLQ